MPLLRDADTSANSNTIDYAYGNSECYADGDAYPYRDANANGHTHCYSQSDAAVAPDAAPTSESAVIAEIVIRDRL